MGLVSRYRGVRLTLFFVIALCLQAAYGTTVFTVDQPVSTKSRSWTYSVKEAGDYQIGQAWIEVISGTNVAVEVFTNGTQRLKALYAPAGKVTRFETRLENLAANATIKVRVSPNGGTYRAGYKVAFGTPTFTGLPVFNVSSYGAVGNGTNDDFAAIQAAVSAAKSAGGGIVRFIGTNTYRTIGLSDLTVEALFDLDSARNIKIEGNGAKLMLQPPDRMANIAFAENIQIEGFTVDYDPKPYYQGAITAINVANRTIDITVPTRYPVPQVGISPTNRPFFGRDFIPDAPGARSGRGDNIYIDSVSTNGGSRQLRIQVPASVNGVAMTPRLQDAFDNNATEFVVPHILYGHLGGNNIITRSSRVKLSNIRYYCAPYFWMSIISNEGPVTFTNVDIKMPNPETELLASWRDGMHIKNGRLGILIENGDWDGAAMYDDTFAIYSRRQVLVSRTNNVVTLTPSYEARETFLWQPGDWASFWSADQQTLRGLARVVRAADVTSPNFEVTLESIPAGAVAGDIVLHEESLNRNTVIRNCTTANVGTKSATTRLRGTDVHFENNHFEEFDFRLEFDDSLGTPRARDVMVENTYFSSVDGEVTISKALGVVFKGCTLNGLAAVCNLGAENVHFDGVAWTNMSTNILSLSGGSSAWLFGGSSRNGSTSGLSSQVTKDASSTISYSAPTNYPPAQPPLGGDITPPLAPTLTATGGSGRVTLDWSGSMDAVEYAVYRSETVGGPYSYQVKTTSDHYVDASGTVGKAFYYVVTAIDVSGNASEYSNEASVTPTGIVLSPVADAYVQGGSYASTKFGTSTVLQCKTDPTADYNRQSYLRFNLSSLTGTVVAAKLRLKVQAITGSGQDTHTAYFVSNDSWSESTLTWNNKPAAGAALAAATFPAVGSWMELDLTAQVANEFAGDKALSAVLISSGTVLVGYYSREAAVGNRPELSAVTADSPPPNPPNGLAATAVPGCKSIVLAWADQSGSGAMAYNVYRGTTPGGPYTLWINTAANSYVDNDVEFDKTYYYVVAAMNGSGSASGYSSENPATASKLALSPVADSFVQGGSYATNNYGTNEVLQCKTDLGNPDYVRQTYLRFDLSSLAGPVVSARLRLKLKSTIGSGLNTHTAYSVSNDSWSESTITWNNKPAAGTALASSVIPTAGAWLELDVTGQVQTERAGDRLFSTVLISDGTVLADYYSKEAAAGSRPELVIETTASGYSLWAIRYQLLNGPNGDDDSDHLVNLYEYGVGGNPTNGLDTGYAPLYGLKQDGGSNWFYYVHPQVSAPNSGIKYYLQLTDGLATPNWTNGGYEIKGTNVNGFAPGLDAVTNCVPMEGRGQRFIRLVIEEQD